MKNHERRKIKIPRKGSPSCALNNTVRTEMTTEFILERAGPVIFKTFFLEFVAFRLIPIFCPANCSCWKLLETIINSKQGLSHDKISNLSEMNSWKHFSGSAIILVLTVLSHPSYLSIIVDGPKFLETCSEVLETSFQAKVFTNSPKI